MSTFWTKNKQKIFLCACDCLFICASYALAIFFYTYLSKTRGGFMPPYLKSLPIQIIGCILVFNLLQVYRDILGFISLFDMVRVVAATGISAFIGYVGIRYTRGAWASPIIGVTAFYIFVTLAAGMRLLPSLVNVSRNFVIANFYGRKNRTNLLIIGAGLAANAFIKDQHEQGTDCKYNLIGMLDDDLEKHGHAIRTVPVLGSTDQVAEIVKKNNIQEIIIAIPSANVSERRALVARCKETGCDVKMMSSVSNVDDAQVISLQRMEINDLLGRRAILLNPEHMAKYIENKTVLITGGGGSIGSELCRQIIKYKPAKLVIFDVYENNAHDLLQDLRLVYKDLRDKILLRVGSVQDMKRLKEVFEEVQPAVVFHAAAYKHVPLMEECPDIAVKNNIFGTYNVAQCSIHAKVKNFVMISTDKAINPTNVMGATKRIAELLVQSLNGRQTKFVVVRFGNVLGSNGSVVSIFKRQIEMGGPVTITHPDITRYFMTIPEAAQLVLQACSTAEGGETFVLDMGEPVKIIDLAHSMIEIAGLEPDVDIPIVYTGLRAGEKLYEELTIDHAKVRKTKDDKIFLETSKTITPDERRLILQKLQTVIDKKGNVKECLGKILPEYVPFDEHAAQ